MVPVPSFNWSSFVECHVYNWAEHHVAVLLAFAPLNVHDHASAIDVADLQANNSAVSQGLSLTWRTISSGDGSARSHGVSAGIAGPHPPAGRGVNRTEPIRTYRQRKAMSLLGSTPASSLHFRHLQRNSGSNGIMRCPHLAHSNQPSGCDTTGRKWSPNTQYGQRTISVDDMSQAPILAGCGKN